jgi:hypothetical protein
MVELMDGTFTSVQEKEYSAEFAIPLVEERYTLLVFPFGPLYHFGTSPLVPCTTLVPLSLTFNYVPEMNRFLG